MSRHALATIALAAVALAVSTTSASAGCSGGGRKYYGGSNLHHRYTSSHNHGRYHTPTVVHRPVVVHKPIVIEKRVIVEQPIHQCYHPKFRMAYVHPGDTWAALCQRVYGRTDIWGKVVAFNNLAPTAQLVPGQQIRLPAIYASGRVVASTAPVQPAPAFLAQPQVGMPAPQQFQAQPQFPGMQLPVRQQQPIGPQFQGQPQQPAQPQLQGQPQVPAQPVNNGPQMNIRQAERKLPTFTAGSSLVLDGSDFGSTRGRVQLMLGPMALPVPVTAWTASEVSILLPELPLTTAADARLVVLDATGNVVNESSLRLAPKTGRLAMGN